VSESSLDDLARRAIDAVAAGQKTITVTPADHRCLRSATDEDWNSALIRNGSGPIYGVGLDVVVVADA
jgi:hypothetical protein